MPASKNRADKADKAEKAISSLREELVELCELKKTAAQLSFLIQAHQALAVAAKY